MSSRPVGGSPGPDPESQAAGQTPTPSPNPEGARGASPAPLAELAWTSEPGATRGPRGRGSASNPAGRFERLAYLADPEALEADRLEREALGEAAPSPRTLYLNDPSKSALAKNSSPDLGFDASLNPYRGCEHGCSYCYARPTHEYLGFSAGLDFETRILVKQDMPALLRKELCGRRWKPQVIAMSGVTDPYQPVERRLEITRRCLGVLLEFRNPVAIITKNALVARDADRLAELASFDAAVVNVSITTLDPVLQRALEPRASHPEQRLLAIEKLRAAGVPVGVMVAPVIPGLTDHEIPRILEAAAAAGASFASHILLRLPYGVKQLFAEWLEQHHPERKDRVLARVREVRGGRLNDPNFGSRMRGEGLYAKQLHDLFALAERRAGLDGERPVLSTEHFRRPGDNQMELGL
jgi:DNA repair photolyase